MVSIRVSGFINAGGGGGPGGGAQEYTSGGGGGAGGEILLEAPTISIDSAGFVAALGGGGGASGTQFASAPGLPGGDAGKVAGTAGQRGNPPSESGGAGAGVSDGQIMEAQPGLDHDPASGGGGGGAGRIWLRYRAATPPDSLTLSNVAPPAGLDPSLP